MSSVALLHGRTAVVTGGGRGLGAAAAVRLGELGCAVAVIDRSLEESEQLAERPPELAVEGDATSAADVERFLTRVTAEVGQLDVLVNNAGIATPRCAGANAGVDGFRATLLANTMAAFVCSGIARSQLTRSRHGGAIVNVTSIAARQAFRRGVAYSASKGALESMTRAMALDLAPAVRVNAVAPAMVATQPWLEAPVEERTRRSAVVPLERPAEPAEIADVIAWLVSPMASYVTGQVILADGGLCAQAYTPDDEHPLVAVTEETT